MLNKRYFFLFLFAAVLTIVLLPTTIIFAQSSSPLLEPTLSVDIPDLTFSQAVVNNNVIEANYLGDYIAAIYTYLLGIATTIAIVVIMIAGLRWSLGGMSSGQVAKAKEMIKNAIVGLVLLLSTYLILFTVNPNLLRLTFPKLETIQHVDLNEFILQAVADCSDIKGTVGKCSATTLLTPPGWDPSLTDIVNTVATTESVDPILIATHIQKETAGNINYSRSIGPCGEIGISQFMPTTFESIVGQTCCVRVATQSSAKREVYGNLCDDGAVPEWPPIVSDIPNCNANICGTCQVAAESCIDYFDTAQPNGIQNTVTATAKLIDYNLSNGRIGGDIALAMCAYNGRGTQAAEYAKSAAKIYEQFCQISGGTITNP